MVIAIIVVIIIIITVIGLHYTNGKYHLFHQKCYPFVNLITCITNDYFEDDDDDNPELNKYKWVHPASPLGLIYPTNAAILHREEKID